MRLDCFRAKHIFPILLLAVFTPLLSASSMAAVPAADNAVSVVGTVNCQRITLKELNLASAYALGGCESA